MSVLGTVLTILLLVAQQPLPASYEVEGDLRLTDPLLLDGGLDGPTSLFVAHADGLDPNDESARFRLESGRAFVRIWEYPRATSLALRPNSSLPEPVPETFESLRPRLLQDAGDPADAWIIAQTPRSIETAA